MRMSGQFAAMAGRRGVTIALAVWIMVVALWAVTGRRHEAPGLVNNLCKARKGIRPGPPRST
jgi:hypothetical protein